MITFKPDDPKQEEINALRRLLRKPKFQRWLLLPKEWEWYENNYLFPNGPRYMACYQALSKRVTGEARQSYRTLFSLYRDQLTDTLDEFEAQI